MDRAAKADIFRELTLEPRTVIHQSISRNADAFWSSRHVAQTTSADVVINFAQHVVELTIRDITFHLPIPFVIFPAVQPRGKLRTLLKRKPLDRVFDFLNGAHMSILSPLDCSSKFTIRRACFPGNIDLISFSSF